MLFNFIVGSNDIFLLINMIATKEKDKPLHKQWLVHHKLLCKEKRSPLMTSDLPLNPADHTSEMNEV